MLYALRILVNPLRKVLTITLILYITRIEDIFIMKRLSHKTCKMKLYVISLVLLMMLTVINPQSPAFAVSPVIRNATTTNVYIPENKNAVSTYKWNLIANACYDHNSSYKPYSGWDSIDLDNSLGKAAGTDGVLRRAHVEITVIDSSTGSPLSGQTVTITGCTLGTNCFIKQPTSPTNSSGKTTGYIEFYGKRSFTVTAKVGSISSTSPSYTVTSANYYNIFMVTFYYYPQRSKYSSMAAFLDACYMEGSGVDDTDTSKTYLDPYTNTTKTGQWYWGRTKASVNSPRCASGVKWLYPKKSMAVDPEYIQMQPYQNQWYKRKVYFNGIAYGSGDDGNRIAEDSGGLIRGYHVDIFCGLAPYGTQSANDSYFSSLHSGLLTDNGHKSAYASYTATIN